MLFGNIQGLVNGTEQVVFDYEVIGSAVTSINTGNILNGDEDGWYTIIFRGIGCTSAAWLRLNGDSGANYGLRAIRANDTTVGNFSSTTDTGISIGYSNADTDSSFSIVKLYAKSGTVRLCTKIFALDIDGKTVMYLDNGGSVWNNTNDNIINMTVSDATAINPGSRLIILKSTNFTNGTPSGIITSPYIKGSWVRVGTSTLESAASSVTFSGLDGDKDVLYYISVFWKSPTSYMGPIVQPNADSNTNYGQQYLYVAATIGGVRETSPTGLYYGYDQVASGNYGFSTGFIFAKSGFIRPSLCLVALDINGSSIRRIDAVGGSWNNTADNITSLRFLANSSRNFDTGSKFELYALRPNG